MHNNVSSGSCIPFLFIEIYGCPISLSIIYYACSSIVQLSHCVFYPHSGVFDLTTKRLHYWDWTLHKIQRCSTPVDQFSTISKGFSGLPTWFLSLLNVHLDAEPYLQHCSGKN